LSVTAIVRFSLNTFSIIVNARQCQGGDTAAIFYHPVNNSPPYRTTSPVQTIGNTVSHGLHLNRPQHVPRLVMAHQLVG
jgi:hypothetical protein